MYLVIELQEQMYFKLFARTFTDTNEIFILFVIITGRHLFSA